VSDVQQKLIHFSDLWSPNSPDSSQWITKFRASSSSICFGRVLTLSTGMNMTRVISYLLRNLYKFCSFFKGSVATYAMCGKNLIHNVYILYVMLKKFANRLISDTEFYQTSEGTFLRRGVCGVCAKVKATRELSADSGHWRSLVSQLSVRVSARVHYKAMTTFQLATDDAQLLLQSATNIPRYYYAWESPRLSIRSKTG